MDQACLGYMQGQCPGDVIRRLRAVFLTSEYAPEEQVDPHDFDWIALSQLASQYFSTAPGVACMLGPMNAEVKARKAPQQRAKKQPPGQLQTTQKVDVATEKVRPGVSRATIPLCHLLSQHV